MMKTYGIRANFAINIAGTIGPMIIALVTMPIYVSYLWAPRAMASFRLHGFF